MKNADLLARLRQLESDFGDVDVKIEKVSPADVEGIYGQNYINISSVSTAVTSVVVTGDSTLGTAMKVSALITALDALDDTYGVVRLSESGRACVKNANYFDSTKILNYKDGIIAIILS